MLSRLETTYFSEPGGSPHAVVTFMSHVGAAHAIRHWNVKAYPAASNLPKSTWEAMSHIAAFSCGDRPASFQASRSGQWFRRRTTCVSLCQSVGVGQPRGQALSKGEAGGPISRLPSPLTHADYPLDGGLTVVTVFPKETRDGRLQAVYSRVAYPDAAQYPDDCEPGR
jgi:hypothetical protein